MFFINCQNFFFFDFFKKLTYDETRGRILSDYVEFKERKRG
ncbi:hypothetical protein O163_06535 [Caldanaerobacter subterraneus subsp. yonseiensis KB-1]|uniref:Uncharacterized protein n=1 Tax=Caldanaerobacter subterraneus subsp. yonseiensis KB-1 TaxID=1388761 RepID=U5CH56_CALSX|nr:hypothetical protein O163_06535 [Caldanaerobacter subterraneus subsp. yonseiensis KB-1]